MTVIRAFLLLCTSTTMAFACGGRSTPATSEHPTDAPPPEPPSSYRAPSPGWTLHGDAPYGRSRHCAVYDEANQSMIIFGGDGGNDTWSLSLGDGANVWRQLFVTGDV